ncbi:response regulator [Nitrosomonas mobilis]|uniref:Protein PilH n=1 Tax=Nitrosomonas mobilis TaxID=51642 RepID=A0A1G5SE40_9PROT|nr:response regulator [Nitrosomonas mobilis]SCZ85120.1 Protein PilH [Nitrosomonas mobilis]HNO74624.1 response regulator [Nitrosomonas mobilis]
MIINTILVIDDSPTDRHILSRMLTKGGYQVGTAESGEEGVLKIKQYMPDLVLMDVVMPGINGFQATRMLARDDETRHIPVILCTSKDQETDKIWGLRQGARAYITKPVSIDDLLQKIKNLDFP